jgi:phage anti-repressor protein
MKADEKVVERLQELKVGQMKAWGGNRTDPDILEFDRLLVEELERGVSAVELALLLGYKTSQAITNRYKRVKQNYSIGFTQSGEVKSTQKNRVGRPRAVAVDITAVKILAELEIVSKHYLDLQKKREELIVRAFDNKVSAREIAEATGITKFNAKYFQEQKRKGLIGGEIK